MAIQTVGTNEAGAVMREIPINDVMTKNGSLRVDGRVIREELLMRAKRPADSKSEWDLLEVVETISCRKAFRPLNRVGAR
jgi:branched-chain amino acid transport system substrate-binding protein